jgi:hypothetical protein
MIRHIVMFKLREFADESEKQTAIQQVLNRLAELPSLIPLIRRYEAASDIRKLEWSYDISLVMDFDSMADLEAYTVHPDHQAFVAFNKAYSVAKVCIDYPLP